MAMAEHDALALSVTTGSGKQDTLSGIIPTWSSTDDEFRAMRYKCGSSTIVCIEVVLCKSPVRYTDPLYKEPYHIMDCNSTQSQLVHLDQVSKILYLGLLQLHLPLMINSGQ